MSRDECSAATVVLAFLVGAVSGAALALMFAPATGEETRKFLKDKAREGRDRAADAMEKGRELWNQQREHLASAFERGREAYQQARNATPPGTPGEGM